MTLALCLSLWLFSTFFCAVSASSVHNQRGNSSQCGNSSQSMCTFPSHSCHDWCHSTTPVTYHPQPDDTQMCPSSQAPSLSTGSGPLTISLISPLRWPGTLKSTVQRLKAPPTPTNLLIFLSMNGSTTHPLLQGTTLTTSSVSHTTSTDTTVTNNCHLPATVKGILMPCSGIQLPMFLLTYWFTSSTHSFDKYLSAY